MGVTCILEMRGHFFSQVCVEIVPFRRERIRAKESDIVVVFDEEVDVKVGIRMPSHRIFGITGIPIQPPDPGLRGLQTNGQPPGFGQLLHPIMNVENGLGPFRKPLSRPRTPPWPPWAWWRRSSSCISTSARRRTLRDAPPMGLATGVGSSPVVVDVVKHHRPWPSSARNTPSLSTLQRTTPPRPTPSCFTLVAEHPVDPQ